MAEPRRGRQHHRQAGWPRRHLPTVTWVTVVWVMLWADLTVANVLAGMGVGLLVSVGVGQPDRHTAYRVSVPGLVKFALVFIHRLVMSTLDVARRVVSPPQTFRPAVVRVDVPLTDPLLLALVANAVTLTPGTMTIDIRPETGSVWVHALHLDGDPSTISGDVLLFADLAAKALRPVPLQTAPTGGSGSITSKARER